MRDARSWRATAALLALGLHGACDAPMPLDAGSMEDAATPMDAAMTDAGSDAALDDAGTGSAVICPAYDAHARACFGEDTGEDFLAECFDLYALCGDVLPEVVRCRLETACADLASCTGRGC